MVFFTTHKKTAMDKLPYWGTAVNLIGPLLSKSQSVTILVPSKYIVAA